MKIDISRIKLASQLAGELPEGNEIIGLITEGDRANSALVRNANTGIYMTVIANAGRSIDQRKAAGAHFSAIRREAGLTQQAAADTIGVTLGAVEHWEQGRRMAPKYAFNALAR